MAHSGLAQVYLAQGDSDGALSELETLRGMRHAAVPLMQFSTVYAVQGEKSKALTEMEKALDAGYRDCTYLETSPYFDSLRSDPQFQQLVDRCRR